MNQLQLEQKVTILEGNIKTLQGQLTKANIRIKELSDLLYESQEEKKKLRDRLERLEKATK